MQFLLFSKILSIFASTADARADQWLLKKNKENKNESKNVVVIYTGCSEITESSFKLPLFSLICWKTLISHIVKFLNSMIYVSERLIGTNGKRFLIKKLLMVFKCYVNSRKKPLLDTLRNKNIKLELENWVF